MWLYCDEKSSKYSTGNLKFLTLNNKAIIFKKTISLITFANFRRSEKKLFEKKWQTEKLTAQLKAIMDREFLGLKTDLTVDFDERVIQTVDKIDNLVETCVQNRLEKMRRDIIEQVGKKIQAKMGKKNDFKGRQDKKCEHRE